MTTQTNNTIEAATKLHSLMDAVTAHDTLSIDLNKAYDIRAAALESLLKMGFKAVQSGKSLRYNPNAEPKANEFSYKIASAEFTARFTYKNPEATEKQIRERVKQDIQSLSVWLSTGKFLSNVGRDKPKLELELASAKFEEIEYQFKQAEQQKKAVEKIAKDNLESARIMQEQVIAEQAKLKTLVKPEAVEATQARIEKIKTAQDKINEQVKEDNRTVKELDKTVKVLAAKVQESKKDVDVKQSKVKPVVKSEARPEVTKHDSGAPKLDINLQCSKEGVEWATKQFEAFESENVPASFMMYLAKMIQANYAK